MRTHPVFLRLEDRRCVVVGGDAGAAAKAAACLRVGARLVVVAPTLGPEMAGLVARGGVEHRARAPRRGDLAGAVLAYASTREPDEIAALVAEAERERVLLNVIDVPDACSFLAPAVIDRGDLQVAVGTGGASPGLASRLRTQLEAHVGPEYVPFVAILGAVRGALGADPDRAPERSRILTALLTSPLLDLVRRRAWDEVDLLLGRIAGDGVTLERLGVVPEGTA